MKNLILFILCVWTTTLFSQNFNDAFRLGQQNLDFDARTLSLGNSTIGAFGNFSSAIINPAGLGTVQRDVFSISFNSNGLKNSADFFNTTTTADQNNGNVNQVSIIMPLPVKKGNAVFALGYNQVNDFNSILKFDGFNNGNNSMIQDLTFFNDDMAYELGLSYPLFDAGDNYIKDETNINGKLNQSGSLIEKGTLDNWLVSGAAEVAKNLFLGGSLNFISGEYKTNRTYQEDDLQNNNYQGFLDPNDSSTVGFETFYLNDNINMDISGWDFRLGILYKINEMLNFGATIKFPSFFTVKERYSIYGESEFTQNYFVFEPDESRSEYDISTPMEFSGGFSATFPMFTLNASAKIVDYSQLEFEDGFTEDELFSLNEEINEVFETTINWNLGAEFTLPYPALKLRAGFIYNPSPYINDGSEFDKKYITAGLGFPITKKLLFDFAYVHGWWKNFGDNYGVEVSRTYQDISLNKYAFSISYIIM